MLKPFQIQVSRSGLWFTKDKFEGTKVVIKNHKSKDRQYNGQKKKDKEKFEDIKGKSEAVK